jgi:hypothetical protein
MTEEVLFADATDEGADLAVPQYGLPYSLERTAMACRGKNKGSLVEVRERTWRAAIAVLGREVGWDERINPLAIAVIVGVVCGLRDVPADDDERNDE